MFGQAVVCVDYTYVDVFSNNGLSQAINRKHHGCFSVFILIKWNLHPSVRVARWLPLVLGLKGCLLLLSIGPLSSGIRFSLSLGFQVSGSCVLNSWGLSLSLSLSLSASPPVSPPLTGLSFSFNRAGIIYTVIQPHSLHQDDKEGWRTDAVAPLHLCVLVYWWTIKIKWMIWICCGETADWFPRLLHYSVRGEQWRQLMFWFSWSLFKSLFCRMLAGEHVWPTV